MDPVTIRINSNLDTQYHQSFPFMTNGDDRNRLLVKSNVVSKIILSTKAWVKDVVVGENLCPFAGSAYAGDTVKYRVFLGNSPEAKIMERVKYEVRFYLVQPYFCTVVDK